MAKVLELQLQHQSFPWIFRVDFLWDWLIWLLCCPRDSQESSPAPEFESINSSLLSLLYGPTLTSIHDYWKNLCLMLTLSERLRVIEICLELGHWDLRLAMICRVWFKKQTPLSPPLGSDRDCMLLRDLKGTSRGGICLHCRGRCIFKFCQSHHWFKLTSFSEHGIKIFYSSALCSRNTINSSPIFKG